MSDSGYSPTQPIVNTPSSSGWSGPFGFSGITIDDFHRRDVFMLDTSVTASASVRNLIFKMRKNGGGCILWPDEILEIQEPIILEDNMGIVGVGMKSGCRFNNEAPAAIELGRNSTLQNFTVLGNSTANTNGVKIKNGCARYYICNVRVHHFAAGLYLRNCYIGTVIEADLGVNDIGLFIDWEFVTALHLFGGSIDNCRIGIFSTGSAHMGNMISTTIKDNQEYGIRIDKGHKNLRITNCFFQRNGNAAIYLAPTTVFKRTGIIIRDNYFTNEGLGIDHQNGEGTFITGNNFHIENPYLIGVESIKTIIGPNYFSNMPSSNDNLSSSTVFYGN